MEVRMMGGGNNLSWYDLLSIVYPIAPVAVTPYGNNNQFVYLKDISIEEELPFKSEDSPYDGIFLYDKPGLGNFENVYGQNLKQPDAYKYDVFTDYSDDSNVVEGLRIANFGITQYTVEIDGITFYKYETD